MAGGGGAACDKAKKKKETSAQKPKEGVSTGGVATGKTGTR